MSPKTQELTELVELLPEKQQTLILELVISLLPNDDILTPEDLADIAEARAEYARGECIDLDDFIAAQKKKIV